MGYDTPDLHLQKLESQNLETNCKSEDILGSYLAIWAAALRRRT